MTERSDRINYGLASKAIGAITEMKNFGISPEALSDAADLAKDKNRRLSDKLSDLSKIMALYDKLLSEKFGECADECASLAEKLRGAPDYLRGESIFIEGFTSFTESQYKLIGALLSRADVKIGLTLPKHRRDAFEFSETRAAEAKLIRIAARAGAEVFVRKLGVSGGVPIFSEICDLLWRTGGEPDAECLEESDRIRIFEADNPYEECDFIASDIKRRVISGEKYSDFAIIARNAEKYSGILDVSLMRCNVPHFISKRRDISGFEATKLLQSAIRTVSGGFAREDLMTYAKCGLLDLSREACDEFELYAERWQISGRRFFDGGDWNMRPEGYSARSDGGSEEKLRRINETRRKITEPLVALKERFSGAACVLDFATALVDFMVELQLEGRIRSRAALLLELGELEAADEHSRLFDGICAALDTLVSTLGDLPADAESFRSLLELTFSECDVGRIPAMADSVTVGSADSLRLGERRHVYIIGANRAEFPMTPSDGAYFNNKDKSDLSAIGLPIEENAEFDFSRELFYFSRSFSLARESLTISYSSSDRAFKASEAAEVIARISSLSGGRIKPIAISSLPAAERVFSPELALEYRAKTEEEGSVVRAALLRSGYEKELETASLSIENSGLRLGEATTRAMFPGDIALTQTRIDKYIDCPLQYFCRFGLRLSENERAEFDARNIGSFIHSVLEKFFFEVRERSIDLSDISDSEKREIANRAANEYLTSLGTDDMRGKRTEFAISRLEGAAIPIIDGICKELQGSDFKPTFFELKIGDGKDGAPRATEFRASDGRRVRVFGSIDRVDTYVSENGDAFIRVIDYKTGTKNFSPDDLDEGRNLQMFLYLRAVVETESKKFRDTIGALANGELIPAGVIYVKAELGDVKVEHDTKEECEAALSAAAKREGMLLDDAESISHMNSEYIPIKYNKDGSVSAKTQKYLYTPLGWDEISDKVSAAVTKVADGLIGGNIKAKPKSNGRGSACEYCSYKPFCRNAKI